MIEVVASKYAAPTNFHQIIAGNIVSELRTIARRGGVTWVPPLAIGTRVPASSNSLPQPGVQVLEHGAGASLSPTTSGSIVLFEVLSKSNTRAEQTWRKEVYARIPNP